MLVDDLNRFIEEQVKAGEFSGTVLVVKDEKTVFEYTAGFANVEKRIPNSLETKFNIGSMDKMFTSIAIAQLEQKGEIGFQEKLEKYLPHYPKEIARKVTIHHILTHTEGFSSYLNKKYIDRRLELKTVNGYLELFKDEPLLFEPGEKYQYSNSGYVVLGAIIENVTGNNYYEYVTENIFNIAEMPNTGSFSIESEDIANGYTFRKPFSQDTTLEKRRNNQDDLPFMGSPAGGGYSTSKDLYSFSKALLDNKLLSDEMTKFILTPKEKVGSKEGTTLYYGYGFQILDVGYGHHRYGHGGTFAGVNTRLDMYPWLGYSVVVLSNYDQPAASRIANRAGKLILAK